MIGVVIASRKRRKAWTEKAMSGGRQHEKSGKKHF
jgi:hypothetical protein